MTAVSRETADRLSAYAALLRRWNSRINLVGRATIEELEERHLRDSLQLASLSRPEGLWADLGSGAGLPGIVLAAAWQGTGVRIILVESDQRKAAFLRQAIRELALAGTEVLNQRIESAAPLNADHVSARALAALPKLMSYATRHLQPLGTAWLPKGRSWRNEVEEARRDWRFKLAAHPSETDPQAAILELTDIFHA